MPEPRPALVEEAPARPPGYTAASILIESRVTVLSPAELRKDGWRVRRLQQCAGIVFVGKRDDAVSWGSRPVQRARYCIAHGLGVERRDDRRCGVRGQLRAPSFEDGLWQAELAQHAAHRAGTKPGSERELQPARQPGIARHAGGDEAGKLASVLSLLWRLDDIQRTDRPRGVHHQRVGYPVENAKHKRKSGTFLRKLDECIGRAPWL